MFLQLGQIHVLLHRYLRRFFNGMTMIESGRLAQRLERRVPADLKGPATRAILQNAITEMAARHGLPMKW